MNLLSPSQDLTPPTNEKKPKLDFITSKTKINQRRKKIIQERHRQGMAWHEYCLCHVRQGLETMRVYMNSFHTSGSPGRHQWMQSA